MPPPDAPTAPTSDEAPAQKTGLLGDLTTSKILAGAGAAATSAIAGSYLGAMGTVAGAAVGSLVSTLATSIYQRSLERTQTEVIARIRPVIGPRAGDDAEAAQEDAQAAAGSGRGGSGRGGSGRGGRGRDGGTGTVDMDADTVVTEPVGGAAVRLPRPRRAPDDDGRETQVLRPVPPAPKRSRRRRFAYLGLAALVFLIGMLAVTGFELVRGGTLWGGEGDTSIGRVVAPASNGGGDEDTSTDTTDAPATETPTSDPDATETTDPDASSSAEPTDGADPSGETDSEENADEDAPTSAAPTSAPAGGGAPAQQGTGAGDS